MNLTELKEKALKATPGLWYVSDSEVRKEHSDEEDYLVCDIPRINERLDFRKPNRDYIAACSPDVILTLIEALEEAQSVATTYASVNIQGDYFDPKTFGGAAREWLAKYGNP